MKNKWFGLNEYAQKVLLTIVLVIYIGLMIFGAAYSKPQDIPVFSGHTKYFHFFGFGVLAILVLKAFELYKFKHKLVLSAIVVVLFAIFTEYIQLFTVAREFAYTDMLIDVAGGILGWGLYKWIFSKL